MNGPKQTGWVRKALRVGGQDALEMSPVDQPGETGERVDCLGSSQLGLVF